MSDCGHDEWEEWMDYCTQCGESSLRVIVAEKRIKELEKCGEHRQDIIEILEKRVEELEGYRDILESEVVQRTDRIKELESQELGWMTTLSSMELEARTLRVENQRLREALRLINDRASYHLGTSDSWLVEVTGSALLGGGDDTRKS